MGKLSLCLANLSKVSVRQSGYSVYSLLSLVLFVTFKQPSIQYPLQSFNEDGSSIVLCKSLRSCRLRLSWN